MDKLSISVELETPLALGRTFFTLDAVLHGILLDLQTWGASELDPIDAIPIACENGLYMATAATFEQSVEAPEIKLGGIRPVRDMHAGAPHIERRHGKLARVHTDKGPTKAHISRMRSITTSAVTWQAIGDGDRIEAMLSRVASIGGLRKDGHGKVRNVIVEPGAFEEKTDLLWDGHSVRRPIPVEIARDFGFGDPEFSTVDTWRPAYWDQANAAQCLVPMDA